MTRPLLLVDSASLYFRAFFGVPESAAKAPDGMPVNAVRGFLDMIATLVRTRRPDRLVCALDEDWRPAWRVDLLPAYKAQRLSPSGGETVPDALIPQVPIILAALTAVGIDVVGLEGYEAEDIVASLAAKVKPPIEIASGDRDLFSQVRGRDIIVLYPQKGGPAEVDEAEVAKRYRIPGRAYSDFAILRGDPSDGLPGLPGIGDKTAAQMVTRYGSVEKMLEAGVIRNPEHADYLRRALKVVPPVRDLKIKVPRGRRDRYPDEPDLVAVIGKKYGIQNNLDRLIKALTSLKATTAKN